MLNLAHSASRISNRRPIIVRGRDRCAGGEWHLWVFDGYKCYTSGRQRFEKWQLAPGEITIVDKGYLDPIYSQDYFYHNLGWGGKDNCYFPVGVWDNDYEAPSSPANTKTDYELHNKMICNIRH